MSFINYKKTKNSLANLNLDLEKKADKIKIKNLSYNEGKNEIKINSLVFDNNFVDISLIYDSKYNEVTDKGNPMQRYNIN